MGRQGGDRERQVRDQRFYTPGASPLRQEIERRSAVLLVALRTGPRWLLPVLLVALLLAGLAVPGPLGVLPLLALAGVLGWLGYLSWPSIGVPGRSLRVLALATLLSLAALKATGGP